MFGVHVTREEKRWGVLVVMGRRRGNIGIAFGVVVVEYLVLFEELHL